MVHFMQMVFFRRHTLSHSPIANQLSKVDLVGWLHAYMPRNCSNDGLVWQIINYVFYL